MLSIQQQCNKILSIFFIAATFLSYSTTNPIGSHLIQKNIHTKILIFLAVLNTYVNAKKQQAEEPTSKTTLEKVDNELLGQAGRCDGVIVNDDHEVVVQKGRPTFGFFARSIKVVKNFIKNLKSMKDTFEVLKYFQFVA